MKKSTCTRLLTLTLLAIVWICKPIPYEDVVHNRNTSISQKVLSLKGGGQDSTSRSNNIDEPGFIPPKTNPRLSPNPAREPEQPKRQNIGQKVTYKQPSGPPSGGLGGVNYDENLPNIPDDSTTISDPEIWNKFQGQETDNSEDELQPTSPPTYKVTKESIKENDFLTKNLEPREFTDWEGDKKVIKSKELKKSVFSHGQEAGTSGPQDSVECPIQPDPLKHQRKNCSQITDKNAQEFSNKIVDLATSKKVGMVKFKTKMPYFDSEMAVGHLNVLTGECVFFHEKGKYWTYKKYLSSEIPDLLADVHDSVKWASQNSSPMSEL